MSDSRDDLAHKVYSLTANEKIELLSAVGTSSDAVEQQLTDILLQLVIHPSNSRDRGVFTSKLMEICSRRLLQRNGQNVHSHGSQPPVTSQQPGENERPSTSQAAVHLNNQSTLASEQLNFPYADLSQSCPTVFPPPACFRSQNPQFSLSSPGQSGGNIRNLMLRPQLSNYTANLTPIPVAIPLNNMSSIMPFLRVAKFKTNPFYENKLKLLPPTRLIHTNELTLPQDASSMRQYFSECTFSFSLTAPDGSTISQSLMQSILNESNIYRHHIVIRIGKFNENSQFYEEVMPLNLQIRVNQNYIQLPPLRYHDFGCRHVCKYVVITDETQLTPGATNSVVINWVPETDKIFYFDICIGRIIPYQILFCHILIANYIKWDVSLLRVVDLIKYQTEQDGVGRRTARFSLNCPLSGQRITYPSIGKLCQHIQMFDIENYLRMNEIYNSWTCPICQQCTPLNDLEIHGYVSFNVIRSSRLPDNCNEIEFNVDGAWIAVVSGMQEENLSTESNELSTDDENSTMENVGFSNNDENSTTEDIERPDDIEMSAAENNTFSDDNEMPTVENNTFSDDSEMPTVENNTFSDDSEIPTVENNTFSDDSEIPTVENNTFSDDSEIPTVENNTFSDDSEIPTVENNTFSDDGEIPTVENNTFPDEDETPTGSNRIFTDDDENPTANDNGLSDDNTDFRNTGNAEFATSGISNNNYFNLSSEILNSNVESAPIIIDVIDLTNDE